MEHCSRSWRRSLSSPPLRQLTKKQRKTSKLTIRPITGCSFWTCAIKKDILCLLRSHLPGKRTSLWIATLWRKPNPWNCIRRCWHSVFIFFNYIFIWAFIFVWFLPFQDMWSHSWTPCTSRMRTSKMNSRCTQAQTWFAKFCLTP